MIATISDTVLAAMIGAGATIITVVLPILARRKRATKSALATISEQVAPSNGKTLAEMLEDIYRLRIASVERDAELATQLDKDRGYMHARFHELLNAITVLKTSFELHRLGKDEERP